MTLLRLSTMDFLALPAAFWQKKNVNVSHSGTKKCWILFFSVSLTIPVTLRFCVHEWACASVPVSCVFCAEGSAVGEAEWWASRAAAASACLSLSPIIDLTKSLNSDLILACITPPNCQKWLVWEAKLSKSIACSAQDAPMCCQHAVLFHSFPFLSHPRVPLSQ